MSTKDFLRPKCNSDPKELLTESQRLETNQGPYYHSVETGTGPGVSIGKSERIPSKDRKRPSRKRHRLDRTHFPEASEEFFKGSALERTPSESEEEYYEELPVDNDFPESSELPTDSPLLNEKGPHEHGNQTLGRATLGSHNIGEGEQVSQNGVLEDISETNLQRPSRVRSSCCCCSGPKRKKNKKRVRYSCHKVIFERVPCLACCFQESSLDSLAKNWGMESVTCEETCCGDDSSDEEDHDPMSLYDAFCADSCGTALSFFAGIIGCLFLALVILSFIYSSSFNNGVMISCSNATLLEYFPIMFIIELVILGGVFFLHVRCRVSAHSGWVNQFRWWFFICCAAACVLIFFIFWTIETGSLFKWINGTIYHCDLELFQPKVYSVLVFPNEHNLSFSNFSDCMTEPWGIKLCGKTDGLFNESAPWWINQTPSFYRCSPQTDDAYEVCSEYLHRIFVLAFALLGLFCFNSVLLNVFLKLAQNRVFRKSCRLCCFSCCARVGTYTPLNAESSSQTDTFQILM